MAVRGPKGSGFPIPFIPVLWGFSDAAPPSPSISSFGGLPRFFLIDSEDGCPPGLLGVDRRFPLQGALGRGINEVAAGGGRFDVRSLAFRI